MKIPKSQTWPSFAVDAAAHAKEMADWRAHMARVKADEANGITGIDKHMPHPRPSAHPLIESAVNERNEVDFDTVDDGPTAEVVLLQKKQVLLGLVTSMEREAIATVLPPGKRRLYDMLEHDIHAGIPKPTILGRIKNAVLGSGKTMQEDHEQFLVDQGSRRDQTAAIARAAAQAHHDIEDLTLDNIDAWQPPKLT